MLPYPFASPHDEQHAAPPAPSVARPRKARRVGTAALVALALAGGTAGGGVAGIVAAKQWQAPQGAQTVGAAPQPASAPGTPAQTVASTVFSTVGQAVVEVTVAGQTPMGPMSYGAGTGVVVDARGLILTNNHVVEDARVISVRFSSGEAREAQVLGTDRGNDLALLQVDLPANTPVAPLGDSDQVQVGETAIAIGSPFGLEQTVTQGIISAVHRNWWPGSGRVQRNLLQTDAPINPGNSGGPLLNARGEVIGINSMIESPVRASVGVGFAIPINTAKQLMPQLEAGARIEPVWLGISGQELDPAIARDQNLTVQEGVLVTSIVPTGPAAQAGIRGGQGQNERIPRGGDVITAVDGTPVRDLTELSDQLANHQPGDVVTVTIVRDGQQQQLRVTLQTWPESIEQG